jgi:anaerobic sulfite reductase subunit C
MLEQSGFIRQHGYISQTQKGLFAVRIRTIAGTLTSAQLCSLAELAHKYGNGQVHITTRQSVEIHGVWENRLNGMFQEIYDQGLLLAVRGPRILTIVSCPGAKLCQKGLCNTAGLAAELDAAMVGREQPAKTKIALSGCPNSCAKPQINDIGLHGVVIPVAAQRCCGCKTCEDGCKVKAITVRESTPSIAAEMCIGCGICVRNCPQQILFGKKRGYTIYVGGKIGKNPLPGHKVFTVISEQEAVSYIEAILEAYNRLAYRGERIGDLINRIGLVAFQAEIANPVAKESDNLSL